MKISCTGFAFDEGKIKYDDEKLSALKDKMNPKKFVPFYAELISNNYIQADLIAIKRSSLPDLLIIDMEKCETRNENSDDETEKKLMDKCLGYLEDEIPLCDAPHDPAELDHLKAITILSIKPVLVLDEDPAINELLKMSFERSDTMFFYTAAPNEVHAWHINKGSTILECAAKIHTDLARGFIKGDVAAYNDFMSCHNMSDAIKKGLAKLVDKDHIVQPDDVIEIRSNI
ncbi:DUF933 domain-containing protein [Elusimicrobiota bacterium]